jgi:phage terminase large subunit GpA-like protein
MNIDDLAREALSVLQPPPKYTVSQWADNHRMLSSEASAIPGRWRTSLVEHMREPMDCIGDPRVIRVVIMAGAQIAKSEVLLNVIGYLIDYDPSPIMMVQPTLEMAEAFSKDRVAPMLRDTPVLRAKMSDKGRDSNNTIRQKVFPGGHLTLVGANSPSSLASRPIRAVLFDEVDRFPLSAGDEGDPIQLASKRTATFWNRIIVMVSTPTVKGQSRIEAAYEEGDQRVRYCKCVHCNHFQQLKWSSVKWTKGKPETARYECEECGVLWSDSERIAAVRNGYWMAQAEFNGIASFHVPGLLSPFATMADGVREFIEAQGDPSRLKVWVNTYLGETWEDAGERIDAHSLEQRVEEYESRIPDGVTLLTSGIDVQDDRIEAEIIGWGDNYESWSIDYTTIYGDPSAPAIWQELRLFLKQVYVHPRFGDMSMRAGCIDTGGHYTSQTYQFINQVDRVYGVKGVAGEGKPLVGRPSKNNYGGIVLFPVGVHTAKELVFARLRAKEGEAGYCHFPVGRDTEYFEQLTAEKLVTRYTKGFKRQEYIKTRSRNEALDCRVYGTAALDLLNVDLKAQRRSQESRVAQSKPDSDAKGETKSKLRKKDSFLNRWRNYD